MSLKTLATELHSVRTSWYSIGLELGIPHTSLDWFKQKYSDLSRLMTEMLREWLVVNPHPTWEVIITALRSPSINERKFAAQLEAKYCTPVQHVTEESNSPTKIETSKGIAILMPFCCTYHLHSRTHIGHNNPFSTKINSAGDNQSY